MSFGDGEALSAVKNIAEDAVRWALGLPFPRTSSVPFGRVRARADGRTYMGSLVTSFFHFIS